MGGDTPLDTMANEWHGLSEAATSGRLYFDFELGQRCVEESAAACSRIQAIKQAMADFCLDPVSPNPITSGATLADRFNVKLRELELILGSHETILTDMVGTFTAATNHYAKTEAESLALFRKADPPDWDASSSPPEVYLTPNQPSEIVFPEQATSYFRSSGGELEASGYGEPGQDGPENPASLEWDHFYALGQHISIRLSGILAFSAACNWAADKVDETMAILREKLGEAVGSGWDGEARESAKKAVGKYLEESPLFTAGIRVIADNFTYTMGWLNNTYWSMPVNPWQDVVSSPTGSLTDRNEAALNQMRLAFATYYVPGIIESMGRMPVLPEPVSPASDPGGHEGDPPPTIAAAGGAPNAGGSAPPSPTFPEFDSASGPSPGNPGADPGSALGQLTGLGREAASGLQNAANAAKEVTPRTMPAAATAPASARLDRHKPAGSATGGGRAGHAGAGGDAGALPLGARVESSALFPRAAARAGAAGVRALSSAGMAPMGGYPPGAGAPGRQDDRKYERPDHVKSAAHLADALGEPPFATRPVLEQ
ncbi:MAG: hypothetical protein HOQ24_14985 [Mycobacteriaceae bacterium]|nr:hypothetical protein [Mycobacteriaceae bacterium]